MLARCALLTGMRVTRTWMDAHLVYLGGTAIAADKLTFRKAIITCPIRQNVRLWANSHTVFVICYDLTGQGRRTFVSDGQETDVDVDVTYDDVQKLMSTPRTLLIDVREPDELEVYGRYEGAVNISLGRLKEVLDQTSDDQTFQKLCGFRKPESSATLVFCCMSGVRSSKATTLAAKLGYTNARNYKGGWHDYHKQVGLPFKRKDGDVALTTPPSQTPNS